jgi:xanthine dehydrogenase YagS FAD-binding subunit
LVSAAVAIQTEGDVISEIRIALGGVAHKPWRLIDVERALVGVRLSGTESRRALDAGFNAARPLTDNAFKIELSKRAVLRAVAEIGGLP